MTEESNLDKLRKHLKKGKCTSQKFYWGYIPKKNEWYPECQQRYYGTPGKLILNESSVCYASINRIYEFELLGFQYHYKEKDDPIGERWYNWITDPVKSPWRNILLDPVERIYNDEGVSRGIIIGPKTTANVTKENLKFYQNFFIASRCFNEFHAHIKYWDWAVNQGATEVEAAILATKFCLSSQGTVYRRDVPNVNHWPFLQIENLNPILKGIPKDQSTICHMWGKIGSHNMYNAGYENITSAFENNFGKALVDKRKKDWKVA